MDVKQQKIEKDFIEDLFNNGHHHILEKIYINLPFKTFNNLKNVSLNWKDIFSEIKSAKEKRIHKIKILENQKISSAWKNDRPVVQQYPQFPESQYQQKDPSEIVSAGIHTIVVRSGPVQTSAQTDIHFWNGTQLKSWHYNVGHSKFIANSDYLLAPAYRCPINLSQHHIFKSEEIIKHNENDFENDYVIYRMFTSILVWRLSDEDFSEAYILPWAATNYHNGGFVIDGHILTRILFQSDGTVLFQEWNLSTLTRQSSHYLHLDYKVFSNKTDSGDAIKLSMVYPIKTVSYNLLMEFRQQSDQTDKLFYCRCSVLNIQWWENESNTTLWEIKENSSFKFADYSNDHFVLYFEAEKLIKILNVSDGRLEKVLDYSGRVKHLDSITIQGGMLAYKARTNKTSQNDIFIDDWRTGQNLAMCSQIFSLSNNDLKKNKTFHFSEKKIVVSIGGKVYSAAIGQD